MKEAVTAKKSFTPTKDIKIVRVKDNKAIVVKGFTKAAEVSCVSKYYITTYINTGKVIKGFKFYEM